MATQTDHPHDLDTPAPPRRWLMLTLLAFAQFMLIVDITVVQVALPSIGADLALTREALTWVVTAYTLTLGGLMILGGRLADVLGARRTLVAGLLLFTVASLLCGLTTAGPVLIGARALQGVGAALASPAALALITTTFRGAERTRALGVWAGIGGAGAAAGVVLGGVLTAALGWQWVFFVNVPVGVAVLALIPTLVPASPARDARRRVDLPGGLLITASTGLLIYGLVHAGDAGWTAPATLASLAGAVVGYALFGLVESRAAEPLMRPRLLARRPVVSGTVLMLVATGIMLGLFFLTSLYLQQVLGMSALRTGLLFLPIALAITAGAHVAASTIERVGGRALVVAGMLLAATGSFLLTQAPGQGAVAGVLPGFLVAALGIGPLFVAAMTTTLGNVPAQEAGVTSGVINTFHELGATVGVAVASTVAAASISAGGGALGTAGFTDGYLTFAVVAVVGAVVAGALVPGGRPRAVGGHGHAVVGH